MRMSEKTDSRVLPPGVGIEMTDYQVAALGSARALPRLDRLERALQIVNQIANIFHPNRKPDQRIGDAQFFPLLLGN